MIRLEDYQPHETALVICAYCGYSWVAVWNCKCKELECPHCHNLSIIPAQQPLPLLKVNNLRKT
jgi:hypothetical protein